MTLTFLELGRSQSRRIFGRGCSTAVEQMTLYQVAVGLNPSGIWAFSCCFYILLVSFDSEVLVL